MDHISFLLILLVFLLRGNDGNAISLWKWWDDHNDTLDCTFMNEPYQITDDLWMNHIMNPYEQSVAIELIYQGIGWMGIGFGTSTMISSIATIGVHNDHDDNYIVSSYGLNGKKLDDIEELSYRYRQYVKLSHTDMIQNTTHTILRFTRPLHSYYVTDTGTSRTVHNDTIMANAENDLIWAYGTSNTLSYHSRHRGTDRIVFNQYCRNTTASTATDPERALSPTTTTERALSPSTPTTPQSSLQGTFQDDEHDILVHVKTDLQRDRITVDMLYNGVGWIGIAFTYQDKPYQMIGSQGIIGSTILIPNGGVLKYDLTSKSMDGILLSPEVRQGTLTNRIFQQNTTHTYMKFTKLLMEKKEPRIYVTQPNTILYAVGYENNLGVHKRRGTFTLSLESCITNDLNNQTKKDGKCTTSIAINSVYDSTKSKWKAHGICMSMAWILFIPTAIGASYFRSILYISWGITGDAWFQIHRAMNILGILFTIFGFFIGLSAIKEEGNTLFNGTKHHNIGFTIFFLTLLQGLGGLLRPAPPSVTNVNSHSLELHQQQQEGYHQNDAHHDELNSLDDFSVLDATTVIPQEVSSQYLRSKGDDYSIDEFGNTTLATTVANTTIVTAPTTTVTTNDIPHEQSNVVMELQDIPVDDDPSNGGRDNTTPDLEYDSIHRENGMDDDNDDIVNDDDDNFTVSRPAKKDQLEHHDEITMKSKTKYRTGWEILHRILGFVLLFLAWANCNSGVLLYQNRYDPNSNKLHSILWGLIGTVIGLSVFFTVYQQWLLHRMHTSTPNQSRTLRRIAKK